MKKNLIGAVAAGLALALAFTACESGNDNPILPTDADAAVYEKKTFDYVNTPSEFTYKAPAAGTGALTSGTEYSLGGKGSWNWDFSAIGGSYVGNYTNGENKWNRDVEKNTDTTASTAYTTNRGTVTGDTIGDVVKTKKNTFTVNTVDNTWKYVQESTNKEVFGIVNWTWEYDTGSTTAWHVIAEYSYASRKQVPFQLVALGTNYPGTLTSFAVTVGDATTQSGVTPGAVYYGGTGTNPISEADARDTAITQLKNAVEGQEKRVARLKDDPDGNKSDITLAETRLTLLKGYYDAARAQREGATYVVDESKTVDGVTNGSVTYYTAKGGTVVYKSVTKDAGTKKETTGTYKLLSGNYLTGKLLLTKVEKVTFDANENNVGFYINEGNNNDRGKTEVDYPVASTSKAGSILQYKGRVVDIANGVLKGNEAVITSALNTNASHWYTRGNYLGWAYKTYAKATTDNDTTTGREYLDANKELQTFTLKQ